MSNSIITNFNTNIKKYELKAEMPPLPEGYPISAKVIADSYRVLKFGVISRITTLELVFPRYILAEFNTHRAFSRNASSSRAIPTKKMIQAALGSGVVPVRFGLNQPGMQAAKENLEGDKLEEAWRIWYDLSMQTAKACERLMELGLHKQWASRPLEWFSTIKVVVTATDVDNFFLLRDHSEAQDEICYLAQAWKIAMNNSTPKLLELSDWHIPYVSEKELEELGLENALQVSSARCARTSYKTQHGITSTLEEDIALFERLVHNLDDPEDPFHASPTEHQATPRDYDSDIEGLEGNFTHWCQHRKFLEAGITPIDLY